MSRQKKKEEEEKSAEAKVRTYWLGEGVRNVLRRERPTRLRALVGSIICLARLCDACLLFLVPGERFAVLGLAMMFVGITHGMDRAFSQLVSLILASPQLSVCSDSLPTNHSRTAKQNTPPRYHHVLVVEVAVGRCGM